MTDLKTTAGKIEDLDAKLAESRAPLGEGEPAARTRVTQLLDEGSFVETDALARHRSTDFGREHDRPYTDGVVTGYGTIDGRRVCVFSQDGEIFDGTMGEVYAEKLTKVYDLAIKTGVPIIGIYESTGPRVQEGIVTMAGYARLMARVSQASGLIPQISVVAGNTSGIAAFAPTFADVLVVTQGTALHQAASHVAGAEPETFGGAAAHAESGTAHLVASDDKQALSLVRDVLAYLPANNRAEAPRVEAGSVADFDLNAVIPDTAAQAYDMSDVIKAVVDEGSFFELSAEAAQNIVTGFAYIDGSDPFLVNFVQINDFANADERSWQARYDFDFAGLGVPGLSFMTRYISGDNITTASGDEGKEWERNTDITYVIQEGPLKNLGIKWRNATVRSNFGNDLDENRLILSYTMALW